MGLRSNPEGAYPPFRYPPFRHWLPPADLRSQRIRSSENSFLQFDCDCSAVLSEKSGLANRFCEGIDARLLIGNLRTEDTTGDLCDFRKTMHRRTTEWISLPAMGYWVSEYRSLGLSKSPIATSAPRS